MLAGLDGVIGDVVVVLQPESDPPALLPRFVEAARSSGGVAFGVRTTASEQGWAYRVLRRRFARLAARMLDLELPDERDALHGVHAPGAQRRRPDQGQVARAAHLRRGRRLSAPADRVRTDSAPRAACAGSRSARASSAACR